MGSWERSRATEVYFEGDRLVTRRLDSGQTQVQPLNDREGARTIAQLTPPGYPGKIGLKPCSKLISSAACE